MAKLAKLALGSIGLIAAGLSGGWYYGKGEIQSQLDMQLAEWSARGVAVSYQAVEIGGFPFGYHGKLIEPRSQSIVRTALGPARSDWQTPVATFDATLGELGVINFAMPESQRIRFSPVSGAPATDVHIRSSGLSGKLAQDGAGLRVDAAGEAVEIEIAPPGIAPYRLTVDRFTAAGGAPVDEAGRVSATLDLTGAAVNGEAWDFIDPNGSFPRDPANLAFQAAADTSIRPDRSVSVDAIQVEQVELDIAGLSLRGDGAATVRNRIPSGDLTLRLQGLGPFLGNAARAGYLPEKQANLYGVMLDSFARKGEREGEQVFTVSFKNGFTFVNGAPTFMPAPQLP